MSGAEEFKSSLPGVGSQVGQSCSPPRDRALRRDGIEHSNDFVTPYSREITPQRQAAGATTAPKVSSGFGTGGCGARERKGQDEASSGSSTSPPPTTLRSSLALRNRGITGLGTRGGNGLRRPRAALAWDRGRAIGDGIVLGSELPSCPVCLDRLDPAVSGVPSAQALRRLSFDISSGPPSRCYYGRCFGNDGDNRPISAEGMHVRAGQDSPARPAKGEDDTVRMNRVDSGDAENPARGRSEGVRPLSQRRVEAAVVASAMNVHHEARETPLNLTTWRGSTCRVCRSLDVALEGAPDVVSEEAAQPVIPISVISNSATR